MGTLLNIYEDLKGKKKIQAEKRGGNFDSIEAFTTQECSIPWGKFYLEPAHHALNSKQRIPAKLYQPITSQCRMSSLSH